MAKKLRPLRAWATTTVHGGQIIADTIRTTRREAINAHCEGNSTSWGAWKRLGCRAIAVVVTPRDSQP